MDIKFDGTSWDVFELEIDYSKLSTKIETRMHYWRGGVQISEYDFYKGFERVEEVPTSMKSQAVVEIAKKILEEHEKWKGLE